MELDWSSNTIGWSTDMEGDWLGTTSCWSAGKGIGKEPTKMEEGLDKVLRGVLVETNLGLEEISKARLQEARNEIDNGGDSNNKDL